AGKVIVTTSIGAEGINYTDKKNILIADTPQQFADTILALLNNPEKLNSIAKEAQLLARSQYNNNIIGEQLVRFYQTIR
ncbi:MAG TPA: glycosyltransferase, partial [Bacteroidia bacterium]|nr:glycosyltransferase [Bacteroidia bacterium]